ncbi:PDZ domain-containing protein [Nephila pilipes]|uniref:PDZ domain-containing protein n=1 Tax=Nephila pilipes TaxID=299642 RepID=A0A8X6PGG0_NEPPI|nr:PDZ domain-containing protein [Nephila pilipes]
MAFQRPFLISLKRSDSSNRWGFGINGGRDFGEPIRIQSVIDDSLAEKSGLREGDEIIQVGRVNVQDLNLGQVHEVLARCGNKIEMFIVREDLLSPRKGKEPPVVKAVVHNPYNSPLSLYSTENIAETLAKQTEVLTEGQVTDEEEGPENLSFKQKSAVFQLLEEQAKQDTGTPGRTVQSSQVRKPKTAPPPPPPKPKPPSGEQYYNGYDSHQQVYQDQQRSSRVEYQTSQKVVNQYQYQQEQPIQYQQTTVYQTSSQQRSPGYQSPLRENYQEPSYQTSVSSYQHYQNQQQPSATNYQQTYQQSQSTYQQQGQGYQSPTVTSRQQYPGFQSPTTTTYQQLNQVNYQQNQNYQSRSPDFQQTQQPASYQQTQQQTQKQQSYQQNQQATRQQTNYQQNQQSTQQQTKYQQPTQQQTNYQKTQQSNYQQQKTPESPTAVSKAEFKIGPPPPPRGASTKQQQDSSGNMTAIYKQQYEQHLQKQYEQQQLLMNSYEDESMVPKAHIIEEDIFEHNSTSGTPITYKAPPAAPPKPNWPPPPSQDSYRSPVLDSSRGSQNVSAAWPPKKSSAVDLPKTGFNTQGSEEPCGSPPSDDRSAVSKTPQSPITGRRESDGTPPSPHVRMPVSMG